MAFSHGKATDFYLDDNGGTARDLSSYLTDVTTSRGRSLADVTTFNQNAEKFLPGLQNGTISLTGKYDPTPAGYLNGLEVAGTATSTFTFFPAGSASGNIFFRGECWLESFDVSSSVSDANAMSASLRIDGTVTLGTA